jgi:multiple antibiotic resistance protein
MISVIQIILLLSLASPLIQSNDLIFDAYQFNGNNSIMHVTVYTQQDLFSKIEKLLVPFVNTTSNASQMLLPFIDTFGDNILKYTIALFVVIDPIGTVPLFIALTEKMKKEERKAVSKVAVITAGVLLIVFAVAGTQILNIFGITIFSFMIAGGVLLFIVSIELLTYGAWRFGGTVSGESGVVPLAFPLLAGPGAITSVIISFQAAGLVVTILSIAIVIGVTYIILLLVNPIYRVLGRRGSMIITRVFAVLVAAIAVQYIVQGATQLYLTTIQSSAS